MACAHHPQAACGSTSIVSSNAKKSSFSTRARSGSVSSQSVSDSFRTSFWTRRTTARSARRPVFFTASSRARWMAGMMRTSSSRGTFGYSQVRAQMSLKILFLTVFCSQSSPPMPSTDLPTDITIKTQRDPLRHSLGGRRVLLTEPTTLVHSCRFLYVPD